MANHTGAANKFVSVNLNKSYGRPVSSSPVVNGYGNAARSYGRGGMVVLSRSRTCVSSATAAKGPRLAVPPPMNLPSLRKEHEKTDSASAGGHTGSGNTGAGVGIASSAAGWTKPQSTLPQSSGGEVDGVSGGRYMPPGARTTGIEPIPAAPTAVEKAVVLRGEDFPSLRATVVPPTSQLKESQQKQRKREDATHELPNRQLGEFEEGSSMPMRPQTRPRVSEDRSSGVGYAAYGGLSSGRSQRDDGVLPELLPLVRLSHVSDWGDDERDTGNRPATRDQGYSRNEDHSGWNREFSVPRSAMPRSSPHASHDLPHLQRSSLNAEREGRDVKSSGIPTGVNTRGENYYGNLERNGGNWRSSLMRGETGIDRNSGSYARPPSGGMNRDSFRENNPDKGRSFPQSSHDNGSIGGPKNSWFNRDAYQQASQRGVYSNDSNNARGMDHNSRSRLPQSNNFSSRSSFASMAKGVHLNDPLLNFGREKRFVSSSGKPYSEDGLDGNLEIKVVKKKKEVQQTDFYDPVRESFEAELERVQKMQEQERQRAIEEQARVLEMARKEHEERERLAREEEEMKRRLEEEAREAVWRAEQERLEVARAAEEQRRAREEEKRRAVIEEERRKEAARQKLLELEARIARRQAEAVKGDTVLRTDEERLPTSRDQLNVVDAGEWEDDDKLGDRIASSGSSDSLYLNRSSEAGSRTNSLSHSFERPKDVGLWRRDRLENGTTSNFFTPDHDNSYLSSSRESLSGGRGLPRRDFRGFSRIPGSEIQKADDSSQLKGQRWSFGVDGDHFGRNTDNDGDYSENSMEKFGDSSWGQGNLRGIPHSTYADRLYQNSDVDSIPYVRSRHSVRQPRVLPPPALSSLPKTSSRGDALSSSFGDSQSRHPHPVQNEGFPHVDHRSGFHRTDELSEAANLTQETATSIGQTEENATPRCDSQSSLSVSSAPNSPAHLSHDEIEELENSGNLVELSENENEFSMLGTANNVDVAASGADEDSWVDEANKELQEQEEYDEEEDGYHEEEDAHEEEYENFGTEQDSTSFHAEGNAGGSVVVEPTFTLNEGISESLRNNSNEQSISSGIEGLKVSEISDLTGIGSVDVGDYNDEVELPEGKNSMSLATVEAIDIMFQGLDIQPVDSTKDVVLNFSSSFHEGSDECSAAIPVQHIKPSSGPSASHLPAIQPVHSAATSIPSQGEAPVHLQFGLFSGPLLIPSPLPAIQIGSIQMPLHLHPQVRPSLTQLHPSQPPLFQFGQLSYPGPISRGILPLGPHTVSYVQPTVSTSTQHPPSPQSLSSLNGQVPREFSSQCTNQADRMSFIQLENESSTVPKLDLHREEMSKELNKLRLANDDEPLNSKIVSSRSHLDNSLFSANNMVSTSLSDVRVQNNKDPDTRRVNRGANNNRGSRDKFLPEQEHIIVNTFSREGIASGSRAVGTIGSRGKRTVHNVRNASQVVSENSHLEPVGFKKRNYRNVRREFRARENVVRSPMEEASVLPVSAGGTQITGSSIITDAVGSKVRSRRGYTNSGYHENVDAKVEKVHMAEAPTRRSASTVGAQGPTDGNLKINAILDEDLDAPLQSGVVRVYKQPGIEAPSDEDDFIEVRSKRQMLNDRREQREKEIKAKSRALKASRKTRPIPKNDAAVSNFNKITSSSGITGGSSIRTSRSQPGVADASSTFTGLAVSHPLPPIGTPPRNADPHSESRLLSLKSISSSSFSVAPGRAGNIAPGLSVENKNVALDNVQTALSPWTSSHADQTMAPINQIPGEHNNLSLESGKVSSSPLAKDTAFPTAASPLDSLLAGEPILFGAITSHTILPSSSSMLKGIGPVSRISDASIECDLSGNSNSSITFFDKGKHSDEPCNPHEDPEAEAEAAASAIAVAAISNDGPVISRLGSGAPHEVDSSSFGAGNVATLPAGDTSGDRPVSNRRGEEPLSVALPADLSVETPSISLWPPLPSPQSSSSPILSHFSGPAHSPFPFFEMNPMLGGQIFTVGPHDESVAAQAQIQKNNAAAAAGAIGAWQHPSGVDSFYGPPTGFAPFIGHSGGIPGIQGPPQMFVYNHFAPVGQFGQMGLRFMGTAYIPSGKQPDWKHTPSSPPVMNNSSMNNMNMVSGPGDPSMPPAMQHLAPGSPLVPIGSPLGLFDMSAYQPPADLHVQARWPHIPGQPLQSIPPLSGGSRMPLPPPDAVLSQHFNPSQMIDSSGNRFAEVRSPQLHDNKKFTTNSVSPQFPEQLRLVESTSSSDTVQVSSSRLSPYISSNKYQSTGNSSPAPAAAPPNFGESSAVGPSHNSGSHPTSSGSQNSNSGLKTQVSQPKQLSALQYVSNINSMGYVEHRPSAMQQKNAAVGEWPRRTAYNRSHTGVTDKSFNASKVKQIYVAKSTQSGS